VTPARSRCSGAETLSSVHWVGVGAHPGQHVGGELVERVVAGAGLQTAGDERDLQPGGVQARPHRGQAGAGLEPRVIPFDQQRRRDDGLDDVGEHHRVGVGLAGASAAAATSRSSPSARSPAVVAI
jgi:hypothetical protein